MPKLQEISKRPAQPLSEDPSPEQATRKAVAAVFTNLGTIVQAMIDRAADGSHLHARLLFDLAGISAASLLLPAEPAAEQPSLTRLLMEKLDQMAEESETVEDERPVE
ncbi:MAG: hypothetical protein M3O85_07200 [Acidobacteriota bacterium]|nr:hypothetical protein [Acidobacteriota bacterium]